MEIFRRIFNGSVNIAMITNMIGTILVFVLVLILNVDVIARGVFHAPIRGVFELVIFSLVLVVFLQLPDVVRSNRLTRSDGFLLLMNDQKPRFGQYVSRSIDLLAGVFMALAAWTMWPEFVESFESCHFITPPEFGPAPTGNLFADLGAAFERCDYAGTPGIFTAPVWPVKLAIAYSVTLCSIIFLCKAILGASKSDPFLTEKFKPNTPNIAN